MLDCAICKDLVSVPVRLKCFPCDTRRNGPTCNSVIRVCLSCARGYLQLNTPREERDLWRKCLVCSSFTAPPLLNAKSAYEKDYLVMSMDKRTDIECPHEGCSFTGNQNELDRHLGTECTFRVAYCQDCREFYRCDKWETHCKTCRGWRECILCKKKLRRRDLRQHQQHDHNLNTSGRSGCSWCKKVLASAATTSFLMSAIFLLMDHITTCSSVSQ